MADTNNTTVVFSVDASGTESGVNKLKASLGQANASMDAAAKKAAFVDAAMKEAAANGMPATAREARKVTEEFLRLERTTGKSRLEIAQMTAAERGMGTTFASISKDIEEASKKTHEFGFATAQSKRELLVLAHEASQGNWKKFGGSLMVLGEQTGAAGLLFSAAGVAAIALGAAIAGAAVEVYKGYAAFDALNKAAGVTNNYLGLTSSQLLTLARSTAGTTGSITQTEEAMSALVNSGKIAADTLGIATKVTTEFAQDTGVSVDKAAEAMVKFAEDPQKALQELQGQFHTFSAAQVDVIENYLKAGDKAAAYKAIVEGMDEAHARFKASGEASVGYVASLWEGLKKMVTATANAISQVGVSSSHQDDLNAAMQRQAQLRSAVAANTAGGHADIYGYKDRLAAADAAVAAAKKVVDADNAVAEAAKKRAAGGDAELRGTNYRDDKKYASPTEKHRLDLDQENKDFAAATQGLNTASALYEQDLARHLSNIQQINEQYAKRTKVKSPGEGAQNAELARIRGANSLIEAEAKRSETVLKGQQDAGLIDSESYFRALHNIQAKELDDKIANAKQAVTVAQSKKEQSAYETANATYKKLMEERKKVDDDLTTSLEKYQKKRAADIAKYSVHMDGRVSDQRTSFDEADTASTLTVRDAAEYRERIALYHRYLDDMRELREKKASGAIDGTEFGVESSTAQASYMQQQAQLSDHLSKELAERNNFSVQFKKANIGMEGTGVTAAETFASAYTTAFGDAENALESFVTTGKFNFADFTSSVLADMAKLALKMAESSALTALFGGSTGVSGLFSTGLSSLLGLGTSTAASSASSAASSLVGSNSFGFHLATGGHVSGPGSGTSDSIPAMLSNGEYVINARATSQHRGLLEAINNGTAARFATGGAVGSVAPVASSGSSGSGSSGVSVTVNNNGGGSLSEQDAAEIHAHVKALVDKRMAQKMGGQGGYGYQLKHGQI